MLRHLTKNFKAMDSIYAFLVSIGATALIVLTLLTVADIIGRYVFNQPIKGTIEISQQIMAYVIFFGMAYTLVKGAHVRISIALDQFPHRLRMTAEIITDIIGIFFCGLLVWGSWNQFWDSFVVWELMPAAINIPWWPAKLAMPVGFFFMALQFFVYIVSHLTNLIELAKA